MSSSVFPSASVGDGSLSPGVDTLPAHLRLTNPIRMARTAHQPPPRTGDTHRPDEVDEEEFVVHARANRPTPMHDHGSHGSPGLPRSSSSGGDSSSSSHSRLSPAKLFDPRARLIVSCCLVGLACSNIAVGLSGLSAHGCFDLAAFLCSQAFLFAAAIPVYHLLAAEKEKQRLARRDPAHAVPAAELDAPQSFLSKVARRLSLHTTLKLALYTLLWLSTVYSAQAITWLAEDACAANRTLRQLSLFDVMLVLSLHVLVALYYLFRRLLPTRYLRRLQRSVWQTILLLICVIAFVANVAQLQTHDAHGLDTFHWGFSTRPQPCPRDCTAPPASPANVRHAICLNSAGEEVSHQLCAHEPAPTTLNTMLQACPHLECTLVDGPLARERDHAEVRLQTEAATTTTMPSTEEGGEIDGEIDTDGASVPVATDPVATGPPPTSPVGTSNDTAVSPPPPPTSANVRPYLLSLFDPECPRACVEYPPASEYTFPGDLDVYEIPMGCWSEQVFLDQKRQGKATPQGWVDSRQCTFFPEKSTVVCPARPCPAFCDRLATSSVVHAVVYSLLILVLLFSLFYARIARAAWFQATMRAIGVDTWTAYQPTAAQGETTAAAAAPTDGSSSRPADVEAPLDASMPPAAAGTHDPSASSSPPVPSVGHALVLAVRALWLGRNGCHLMKPWWRHLLFLLSICLLSFLVAYSLSNMLFLVEAHCRDFLISAVLNACLTFAVAIGVLALAFQHQDQLRQQQTNPFETIGLLVPNQDDEREGDDRDDEMDEFGLEDDQGLEARTRRQLEMDQPTQL